MAKTAAIIEPVNARKMRLVERGFSAVGAIAVSVLLGVAGVLMVPTNFETVTILPQNAESLATRSMNRQL